jgi:hypothetical protein
MQLQHMKTAVAGAWVLGAGAIALSVNVSSASGWMVLIGLGVLPPLLLMRMWQQPVPTMSESIREVLK